MAGGHRHLNFTWRVSSNTNSPTASLDLFSHMVTFRLHLSPYFSFSCAFLAQTLSFSLFLPGVFFQLIIFTSSKSCPRATLSESQRRACSVACCCRGSINHTHPHFFLNLLLHTTWGRCPLAPNVLWRPRSRSRDGSAMYAYTYTHPPRNLDTRAQLLPHITHGGGVLWHLTSSGAPEAAL